MSTGVWIGLVVVVTALAALSDDIGAVLRMADAVVDLDFWTRAPRA